MNMRVCVKSIYGWHLRKDQGFLHHERERLAGLHSI